MAKSKQTPEAPPLFEVEPDQAGQPTKVPAPPSAKEDKAFVDQVMYWLTAPYVNWPGEEGIWEARGNKTDALVHRLAHHKEIFETQRCTEFEAIIYLSTASLAHPMGHDWFCIYAWLFRRWRPEQGAEIFDGPEGEKLNVNQEEDLARLRSWIFKTQLNHMKAKRAKTEREVQEVEEESQQLLVEQPRLF
jgi:hypothetical protein